MNLTAYVQGTFDKKTKIYGYGCVFAADGEAVERRIGFGKDTDNIWNIAGQLSGASEAIDYALHKRYDTLDIVCDYEGLLKWADGLWQAKKPMAADYQNFVRRARNLGLIINFSKAHINDPFVAEVQQLSKDALAEAEKSGISEIIKAVEENGSSSAVDEGQLPLTSYVEEGDDDTPPFDVDDVPPSVFSSEKIKALKKEAVANGVPRVPLQKQPEEFAVYFISRYVKEGMEEEAGRILLQYLRELR